MSLFPHFITFILKTYHFLVFYCPFFGTQVVGLIKHPWRLDIYWIQCLFNIERSYLMIFIAFQLCYRLERLEKGEMCISWLIALLIFLFAFLCLLVNPFVCIMCLLLFPAQIYWKKLWEWRKQNVMILKGEIFYNIYDLFFRLPNLLE